MKDLFQSYLWRYMNFAVNYAFLDKDVTLQGKQGQFVYPVYFPVDVSVLYKDTVIYFNEYINTFLGVNPIKFDKRQVLQDVGNDIRFSEEDTHLQGFYVSETIPLPVFSETEFFTVSLEMNVVPIYVVGIGFGLWQLKTFSMPEVDAYTQNLHKLFFTQAFIPLFVVVNDVLIEVKSLFVGRYVENVLSFSRMRGVSSRYAYSVAFYEYKGNEDYSSMELQMALLDSYAEIFSYQQP